MAGENTVSTYANALKRLYTAKLIELGLFKNNPTFARTKKIGDFEGSTMDHTVNLSYGQGVGVTVAAAVDARSPDNYERFVIPRKLVFGVGSISGELIRATKTNRGTVAVNALQRSRDNNLRSVKRWFQHAIWSNGVGALGQSSNPVPAANQIQLLDPNKIVWFEIGMKVAFSIDDTGVAGVKPQVSDLIVTKVDRDNGIVTFNQAVLAAVPTFLATDFVYRKGTYNLIWLGVESWVPKTDALAATTFLGVDRSQDVTRLAGLRFENAVGATIYECITKGLARCYREGIEPSYCPLHPDDWQALAVAAQGQVQYTRPSGTAQDLALGFGESIKIYGSGLMVECAADPGVTKGDAWLLSPDSWEFHYAGGSMPELLQDDGVIILREPNEDLYSWRVGAYGNLVCTDPQQNMYVKLP
jgi:hypothetical protein